MKHALVRFKVEDGYNQYTYVTDIMDLKKGDELLVQTPSSGKKIVTFLKYEKYLDPNMRYRKILKKVKSAEKKSFFQKIFG
jgi:hypothetical protein